MQGDAPESAPLAIPSSYSGPTPELKPRDSQLNHTETENLDSDSDEDDLSIPPGVILVTDPMDEMARKADNPEEHTNIADRKPSSNQGDFSVHVTRVVCH